MNILSIARVLAPAQLLGIGESSHGTHEFFQFKTELFKELVVNQGFNTLLFEDSQSVCEDINNFIANGEGNLDDFIKQLYSVWRVEELKQLILWLREKYTEHKIEFVGFDINQTNNNIQKRDELMAKNIRRYVKSHSSAKALVWAHNSHVQTTGSNIIQQPMGLFLKKFFKNKYVAIALLFGKGTFCATKIQADSAPSSDRTLSVITVDSPPPEFAESTLDSIDSKPFFLTNKQIDKIHSSKLQIVRSIGWGINPERVNEVLEHTNIKKSFDGLAYFPTAKHSHPLLK